MNNIIELICSSGLKAAKQNHLSVTFSSHNFVSLPVNTPPTLTLQPSKDGLKGAKHLPPCMLAYVFNICDSLHPMGCWDLAVSSLRWVNTNQLVNWKPCSGDAQQIPRCICQTVNINQSSKQSRVPFWASCQSRLSFLSALDSFKVGHPLLSHHMPRVSLMNWRRVHKLKFKMMGDSMDWLAGALPAPN